MSAKTSEVDIDLPAEAQSAHDRHRRPSLPKGRGAGVGHGVPGQAEGAEVFQARQRFEAGTLARQDLDQVGPEKGRFRSFLLSAFKNFLTSRARAEKAIKRGGGAVVLGWDADELEARCAAEISDPATPGKAFKMTLLPKFLGIAVFDQANDGAQEAGRALQQQAAAVAGLAIGGDGAAMREAVERGDGGLHHPMRGLVIEAGDQPKTAGIALIVAPHQAPVAGPRIHPRHPVTTLDMHAHNAPCHGRSAA